MTLKTGVMLRIQLCITGINYITLENTQYNRNISVMHFPSNAAIVGIMQIQSIITNLFIFN